jgi:hypothetical protein
MPIITWKDYVEFFRDDFTALHAQCVEDEQLDRRDVVNMELNLFAQEFGRDDAERLRRWIFGDSKGEIAKDKVRALSLVANLLVDLRRGEDVVEYQAAIGGYEL